MRYSRRTLLSLLLGIAATARAGGGAMPAAAAQLSAATHRLSAGLRPTPRRDHSLTVDPDRGRLYLFGGRSRGQFLGDLWEFDPRNAAWSELTPAGAGAEPRFGHNALYDSANRELLITMGQAGSTFFADVWAYQTETATWRRIADASPERPAPRYGAAAAYDPVAGRILISHGFTDRGRFDDTWVLDVPSETWNRVATSGALPIKRCLTRGVLDPATGSFFMFGGQTDTTPFLGDMWSLDVTHGLWTELPAVVMPTARHLYSAAAGADGAWHLVGGNTPAGPSGEHWIYTPSQNTWQALESAQARFSHDIALFDNVLYGFGGTDGTDERDDVWTLSPVQ